ncbi:non-heme iron oxygenase ferredoxin subunit [Ancylobacter mangrovi]|uniref:non-heme iron oxygenase ferredoxin subunit n=1 Tax=Ancylobacter mangrovi TaxID=2972472 RepID=UPI0021638583|nr:non-heme iron oxygenase ferredoxin subunit [Ancylobacter mangrovi]MCS0502049.1 non-heme iron oxygenase ferredoxin subunit [Ancylobacter mangrovi]
MTTTENVTWVRAASLAELDEGAILGVAIGDKSIALYRLEDEGGVFATDNICTHALAYLSDGWLDGETIECPLHGGAFNVKTGKGVCAPVTKDLQTYEVRLEDGEIYVAMPR